MIEEHALDRMIYNGRYLERSNNMDRMEDSFHRDCSLLRARKQRVTTSNFADGPIGAKDNKVQRRMPSLYEGQGRENR